MKNEIRAGGKDAWFHEGSEYGAAPIGTHSEDSKVAEPRKLSMLRLADFSKHGITTQAAGPDFIKPPQVMYEGESCRPNKDSLTDVFLVQCSCMEQGLRSSMYQRLHVYLSRASSCFCR